MKRLINHIRVWTKWRKVNRNGFVHKFLVLIGARKSPTFDDVAAMSPKEYELIMNMIDLCHK